MHDIKPIKSLVRITIIGVKMLNLEIRSLFVFKSVFETGSARLAAEMHGISQSKVSRYLSELRDIYSDTLFIRKKTGFLATEKAKLLYPYICQLVETFECVEKLNTHIPVEKECIIAVPPTFSVGLAEHLQQKLANIPEKVSFTIKPSRRAICEEVIQGTVCIALTHRDCSTYTECPKSTIGLLESELLGAGQAVYMVAREGHPIWETDMALEYIAQYPFMVTEVAGFNDDKDPLERFCEQQQLDLQVTYRSHSLAAVIERVRCSDTITFVGAKCAAEFMDGITGIQADMLPFSQFARLHETTPLAQYSLLYRKDKKQVIPPLLLTEVRRFISQNVLQQI